MPTATERQSSVNGSAPAPVAAARRVHLPGEVGAWVFILGDMTVFALLFVVFMSYRDTQPALFAQAQLHLHRSFGLINTLLLLTSSLCVVTAVRAVRARVPRLPTILLGLAFFCGCCFLFNKYLEWSDLLSHGFKPDTNSFYMYFFVLTGLHAFHLLIGMGALAGLITLSRKPQLSERQMMFFEAGACFWHMVDLLWVVLFALLYLVH